MSELLLVRDVISTSSSFGTTAGTMVCERVPGFKIGIDNGAVVFDEDMGAMAIVLCIEDISGVAFTVKISDDGTGRVVFDKEAGVMFIVLNIGGGLAFTDDASHTGGLAFDGETDVRILVCDEETEEKLFA